MKYTSQVGTQGKQLAISDDGEATLQFFRNQGVAKYTPTSALQHSTSEQARYIECISFEAVSEMAAQHQGIHYFCKNPHVSAEVNYPFFL